MNCYFNEKPLILNFADCFMKVQTADIMNVGLSKYSCFCISDL